jgi:hypothetical protein
MSEVSIHAEAQLKKGTKWRARILTGLYGVIGRRSIGISSPTERGKANRVVRAVLHRGKPLRTA